MAVPVLEPGLTSPGLQTNNVSFGSFHPALTRPYQCLKASGLEVAQVTKSVKDMQTEATAGGLQLGVYQRLDLWSRQGSVARPAIQRLSCV